MATTTHRDPVCGMAVDEAKAAGSSAYRGRKYCFCGASSLAKFKAEPDRYVQQTDSSDAPPTLKPSSHEIEYPCPA